MTAEQLAIKHVGKRDPKRHLEEHVDMLMTNNITQCLGSMLSTVTFWGVTSYRVLYAPLCHAGHLYYWGGGGHVWGRAETRGGAWGRRRGDICLLCNYLFSSGSSFCKLLVNLCPGYQGAGRMSDFQRPWGVVSVLYLGVTLATPPRFSSFPIRREIFPVGVNIKIIWNLWL